MACPEHELLRQQWIGARAGYQLALADLQISADVYDFRMALTRANESFSEFWEAEVALNQHLKMHGCAKPPVSLQGRWAVAHS